MTRYHLVFVNAQATPLHFLQAGNSASGLAFPLPRKAHPPLRGPHLGEIMTTLNALTGAPVTAYLSTVQLRDHVPSFVSVSPLTLRDSLTGRCEILFSSQLFKIYLSIIARNQLFCQQLNYRLSWKRTKHAVGAGIARPTRKCSIFLPVFGESVTAYHTGDQWSPLHFQSQLLCKTTIYISLLVSHRATITALMPPASFPMIMGPIISGAKPAVNPR